MGCSRKKLSQNTQKTKQKTPITKSPAVIADEQASSCQFFSSLAHTHLGVFLFVLFCFFHIDIENSVNCYLYGWEHLGNKKSFVQSFFFFFFRSSG